MEGIRVYVPTYEEEQQIEMVIEQINCSNSVTKEIQRDSVTIQDVRALFDANIEKYPLTKPRLRSDANIVQVGQVKASKFKNLSNRN